MDHHNCQQVLQLCDVSMTGSNIIQLIVFILKINNNREEKRQKLLWFLLMHIWPFFSLLVTRFFLKVNQKLILLNWKPSYRKKNTTKIDFFFSIFHFDWYSSSSLIFHSWKKTIGKHQEIEICTIKLMHVAI